MAELEEVLRGFTNEGIVFDELNYLAAKINGLNEWRTKLFTAALAAGYIGKFEYLWQNTV